MTCVRCTKCIKHYQSAFPGTWQKWYFGFFFKACHIEPEEFFWGNPYAPIWFVGRNPYGDPKTIILDERWELLIKAWWHLKSTNHFKKYENIINAIFNNPNLQNLYIGFCDAVKCYSYSFAPHTGRPVPNPANKPIYETCVTNYLIKNYQEYKPYVILFQGALDPKMKNYPSISYKDEVIKSFKSIGITLVFHNCQNPDLQYAVDYNHKLLVILTLFNINKNIYNIYIPILIKNFFYELKQKSNNPSLCNVNPAADICWSTIVSNLLNDPLPHYRILTTTVGIMNPSDVDQVYEGRISSINCSKYCKYPTTDEEQKEKDILDLYKKARESFDAAL